MKSIRLQFDINPDANPAAYAKLIKVNGRDRVQRVKFLLELDARLGDGAVDSLAHKPTQRRPTSKIKTDLAHNSDLLFDDKDVEDMMSKTVSG